LTKTIFLIQHNQEEFCKKIGKHKLAIVEINGKQGFIDEKGSIAIQPIYDWAWSFSEALHQF